MKCNTRFFNNILDQKNGYLTKGSYIKDKIINEFNYISNIQAECKAFFPDVRNLSVSDEFASYEIQKIADKDLGYKFVFNQLTSQSELQSIFNNVKSFFDLIPKTIVTSSDFRARCYDLFLIKNNERFRLLQKLECFDNLNQIYVARGYKSFDDFMQKLSSAVVENISSLNDNTLKLIHGDMCFSNMFFTSQKLYLIDPKGFDAKINISECYKPVLYDIVKLSHSTLGLYDFIINDKFEIVDNRLTVDSSKQYLQNIANCFTDFLSSFNLSIKLVRLFEATLFTSMLSMHQDYERRMHAQCIAAIDAFEAFCS
jgi:hypothetical protein